MPKVDTEAPIVAAPVLDAELLLLLLLALPEGLLDPEEPEAPEVVAEALVKCCQTLSVYMYMSRYNLPSTSAGSACCSGSRFLDGSVDTAGVMSEWSASRRIKMTLLY